VRGGFDADGGHRHGGKSHKANARAAQQAILYGSADKGAGKAGQGKKAVREETGGRQGKERQEVKVEKKVFIPSSVSVGRLADIFGVKICKCHFRMRVWSKGVCAGSSLGVV
jgi:hypothetical protein